MNTLITHVQLFGIGFGLGVAGPCLLSCTPMLVAYIAGNKKSFIEAAKEITVFMSGRLLAYIILAGLAGASGSLLRQFTGSNLTALFRPAAGAISILLGIFLIFGEGRGGCSRPASKTKNRYGAGGLFALGFTIGVAPCGPLTALLFEITLISRTALDGILYGLSFGLGTFVSGFLAAGALSGILTRIPIAPKIFKILCGALLILFGIGLII